MAEKTDVDGIEVTIMSKEEKFWSDVVEARKRDLETIEQNRKYNQAILEMAEGKVKEIAEWGL